jgi:cyclase
MRLTRSVVAFAVLSCAVWYAGPVSAQRPTPVASDSAEIDVLPVQGAIHMIVTGGSNIAVQVGEVGALLVDSGNVEASAQVVAAVQNLTDMPVRFVINTSVQPGHLGGNKALFDIGAAMPGTSQSLGMPIVGHQNGVNRLAAGGLGDVPVDLWPFNTFFGLRKTLYVNGESLELLHQPAAISDADVMVYFRRSDVLVTGDVFNTTSYPHFDAAQGGSLQGVIDALNGIIDLTIPAFNQQGGTLVVPGHGRIASESDVVEYRDMLTIVRDRVLAMIEAGLSFEDVVAAQPSLEYDGLYGSESGPWTTRMFLEAVYDDLRSDR